MRDNKKQLTPSSAGPSAGETPPAPFRPGSADNGHRIYTGKPGSGKTLLMMTLLKGYLNKTADGEHHD